MRHNDHNKHEYTLVRNDWLDYCVLPLLLLEHEVEVLLDVVGVHLRAPDEVQE